jgi:hypothetical protein
MQFVEAFKALGYELGNQRQDWSSAKADGICLSLWTKETDWAALVMDTRIHAGDHSLWAGKAGNKKRIEHARRALNEFDGWVDVVKIDGDPGVGYGTASPWLVAERKNMRWRLVYLDDVSGHLRLEAQEWTAG